MNTNLYKLLEISKYELINWVNFDLVFCKKDFRNLNASNKINL